MNDKRVDQSSTGNDTKNMLEMASQTTKLCGIATGNLITPVVTGTEYPANGRCPGKKSQPKLCNNCKKLVYNESEKCYELELKQAIPRM